MRKKQVQNRAPCKQKKQVANHWQYKAAAAKVTSARTLLGGQPK
jgi:hypothetical protein